MKNWTSKMCSVQVNVPLHTASATVSFRRDYIATCCLLFLIENKALENTEHLEHGKGNKLKYNPHYTLGLVCATLIVLIIYKSWNLSLAALDKLKKAEFLKEKLSMSCLANILSNMLIIFFCVNSLVLSALLLLLWWNNIWRWPSRTWFQIKPSGSLRVRGFTA